MPPVVPFILESVTMACATGISTGMYSHSPSLSFSHFFVLSGAGPHSGFWKSYIRLYDTNTSCALRVASATTNARTGPNNKTSWFFISLSERSEHAQVDGIVCVCDNSAVWISALRDFNSVAHAITVCVCDGRARRITVKIRSPVPVCING